jgi:hypothetical protein
MGIKNDLQKKKRIFYAGKKTIFYFYAGKKTLKNPIKI